VLEAYLKLLPTHGIQGVKIETTGLYCIKLYLFIYLHVPTHPYKAEAIGYRTSHTANFAANSK
jgi:hypothetical protein